VTERLVQHYSYGTQHTKQHRSVLIFTLILQTIVACSVGGEEAIITVDCC